MLLFRLYIAYYLRSGKEAVLSVSSIYPRKTMTNRTRLQSMAKPHKYDQKAEKTKDGELVSSYMCSPESAAEEFEISKRLYYQLTGRSQPKERDVLMYRIIQSFKPGEVTPEQANEIAFELAMQFTGGRHQFVVATHTDRAHIHSHIEINSTMDYSDKSTFSTASGRDYQYVVLQVTLKEKFIGTGSGNLTELEKCINDQARKGHRLHTITPANGGSKGLMGGDRIQATMVLGKII